MFKRFLKFTKKGDISGIADNEDFITLVQVAREDEKIKKKLLAVLSFNDFNRHSALNTWISELALKGAPKKFISAVSCLLDDEVAAKALGVIKDTQAL